MPFLGTSYIDIQHYYIVAFKDNTTEISTEVVYFGCNTDSSRLESKVDFWMSRISSFEKNQC